MSMSLRKRAEAMARHLLTRSVFHGTGPFEVKSGRPLAEKTAPTYTDCFSSAICSVAEKNRKVVAITAAMPDGTGLNRFRKKFPERFF